MEWARTSIDKSVNQPTLPHIVMVLNATDNTIDSNQWDPEFATEKPKPSLSRAINSASRMRDRVSTGRTKFLAWADSARTQSRQHSVRELYPRILYTFSDVVVFVLREARCVFFSGT